MIASASVDSLSQGGRWGSGHPSIVPYAAFEVADGFVVLGAINELMWERLCSALDLSALATDERAASNELRVANRGLVDATIAAAIAGRATDDVVATLNRAGVLVAPVRNAATAVEDPQVAALGLVDELDGIRFTRTPLSQFNRRPLPAAQRLGEDSVAVLEACLGLGSAELDELLDDGVIETPGRAPLPVGLGAGPGAAQASST